MSENTTQDKRWLAPIVTGNRGLQLRSLEDMWRFASYIVKSGLAPKSFRTAESVLIAIQYGAELGFTPMQSLQSLMVVKAKVGMYVETARALVENSPECEWIRDNMNDLSGIKDWTDDIVAVAEVKRHGRPESVKRSFSVNDAKRAGLWGKVGKETGEPSTWVTYPGRMLYNRAMGFCLRDAFPDVLKGIKTVEELADWPDERPRAPEIESGETVSGDALDAVTKQLDEEDHTEPIGTVSVVTNDPDYEADTAEDA